MIYAVPNTVNTGPRKQRRAEGFLRYGHTSMVTGAAIVTWCVSR
jgi:hypothetical protein